MIKRCSFILLVGAAFLMGCSSYAHDDEVMYEKASALTKLSSALEASVYFESPPEGIQDRALLEYATRHDATLLEPFDGHTVKANHANSHGIVLVCDERGDEALLMDLGCTAKLDNHYWQTADSETCEIDLKVTADCPSGSR